MLPSGLASLISSQTFDISVHDFGWSKETVDNLMLCKWYHLASTQYTVESSLRTIWLFINKY